MGSSANPTTASAGGAARARSDTSARRWARLLIALSVSLCTAVAGCGGEDGALTFMTGGEPSEVAYWETLLSEFESESGLEVRLMVQPADSDQRRQELVVPLRSARPDPDVFLMDVVWVAQLAASDWLEPLGPYARESGLRLDSFFPGVVELTDRYGGELVALPVYVDGGLLYYRTDLLGKYGFEGPPRTWEDLVRFSLEIQEKERESNPGFYGYVWQGAQYEGLVCNFIEVAASAKGWRADSLRGYVPAGPGTEEALRFMHDLIHAHGVSPPNVYTEMKEEETRIFFQNGNALFERNWPYAWALHESEGSPVRGKVGIARLPHFPGGRSVSTLGGWHAAISRSSDRKDSAWELMKFVTSFETQKNLALNLGWNPSRTDVYEDSLVIERIPHIALLEGIFMNAVPRPRVPYYSQVSDVLQRHVNAVLSGSEGREEAFRAIRGEISALRERYGALGSGRKGGPG